MRQRFRRRLEAIGVGAGAAGFVGVVVTCTANALVTRLLGASLVAGAAAVIAFWAIRLSSFPVASTSRWNGLLALYIIGLSSLLTGAAAGVGGILCGHHDLTHWLVTVLLVGELGQHFGWRWIDGQGRWGIVGGSRRRLGGAAWVGLMRPARSHRR